MKLVLSAVLIWAAVTGGALAETTRVITTTGRGSVELVPDMATISLGVTHQARLSGEALAMTSTAVGAILQELESKGIANRDMQTNGLSLQPVWSRNTPNSNTPRTVVGFVARNSLSIRVRDLDRLGEILDAVVQDGANMFNGLRFSLQDPEPAIAAARAQAVEDAMSRASQLAKAAGISLGPVQSISEHGGVPRPEMMEMASARMASDVPVASGEVSLSAQVSMVFAIAK